MAEIESVVEPDSVTNDIRREAVAFVNVHRQIIDYDELRARQGSNN
jgi:hypothetical protein